MYINIQIIRGGIKTGLAVLEYHVPGRDGTFIPLVHAAVLIPVIKPVRGIIHKIRLIHGITRPHRARVHNARTPVQSCFLPIPGKQVMSLVGGIIIRGITQLSDGLCDAPAAGVCIVRGLLVLCAVKCSCPDSLQAIDIVHIAKIRFCECALSEMDIDRIKLPGKIRVIGTAAAHGTNPFQVIIILNQ